MSQRRITRPFRRGHFFSRFAAQRFELLAKFFHTVGISRQQIRKSGQNNIRRRNGSITAETTRRQQTLGRLLPHLCILRCCGSLFRLGIAGFLIRRTFLGKRKPPSPEDSLSSSLAELFTLCCLIPMITRIKIHNNNPGIAHSCKKFTIVSMTLIFLKFINKDIFRF